MSYNHRAAPPPPGSYLGNGGGGGGGGGGYSQKDVASFAPHSQAADPYTDRFAMEPMSQQPAPSHYSINSVGGGGGGGGFDGGAGSQGYFAPDKEGEGVGGWIKANKKKTCAGVCCLITLLLVLIQIIVVVKLTKIGDQTFVNHVVITDACSTNMGYQFTSTFTNPSGFGVSTKGDTSVRGIDAQGRVVFSTSVPEVSINGGENTLTFNTEMVVEDEDALAEFLEGVLNKNPSTMTLETDTTISSGGILLGFPLSRTFSQELSFDSDDEKVKEEVAEIKAELAPGDPNAEQRTVVETVDIVDDGDVNKFTLAIGAKQYMGPQTTTFDITLPPLAVKAYQTTAKVNELAEINIDGVTVLEGVADIDLTVVFNAATAANAQPKIQAILNNAEQDESIAIQGTQPNDQCFANRLVSKMTIEMPLMNRDVGGSDSGSGGGGGGGGGGGDVGDEAGGGGGLPPIEVTTVDLDDVDVLDLAFTANVGLLLVEPSVTGAIPAVNAEVVNTGGPRLADVVLNVAFAAGTNEHIASLETDVTNNPITLAVQFVQFFTDPDFQTRVEVGSVPGDNALDALINGLYLDVDFDPDDFAAISPI